jgi:hypothetical protein
VTRTAEALGIDQSMVSRYRSGEQIPTLRIAVQIERLTAGLRGGRIRAVDWVTEPALERKKSA